MDTIKFILRMTPEFELDKAGMLSFTEAQNCCFESMKCINVSMYFLKIIFLFENMQ